MQLERLEDTPENAELVRSILTHVDVFPHITDDASPSAEDFRPVWHPHFTYLLVKDDNQPLGLYLLVKLNAACWEVHTCLLPNAWGARARQAARDLIAWVWENTSCQRLVTNVPSYNRLALRYAERAGMTEYGRNPQSYLRQGKLYDQILLGLSRPHEG